MNGLQNLTRRSFFARMAGGLHGAALVSLLSRDLSETGIRLISPHSFLGQKLWLELPPTEGNNPPRFAVRILWTCAVGDGLFENGGSFLELVEAEEAEAANNSASS